MANIENSLMFEYSVPIQCNAQLDGDFIIDGIAINETTTSNGHKFIADELRVAASSLKGVPLLKDHNNSVDSIVGRVKEAGFDESLSSIPFQAIVKDATMKQMIKDGLINSVSVGAHVEMKDIEELDDGIIVPHNITFKELSLVAVPADAGATFGVALNNAYKLSHSKEKSKIVERRENSMTETETTQENIVESEEEVTKEEESKEESLTGEKVKSMISEAIAELKSADADEEEGTEEVKEESKESEAEVEESEDEEEEEVEVEEGDFNILNGHKSFSLERKSYVYN